MGSCACLIPAVRQATPSNLAIPSPTIGPLGKAKPALRESLHDPKGGARFAKQTEYQAHGGPHFLVRVHDDTGLLVVAKTNRNGETQLAFLGLVELTALEARVQKM